MKDSVLLFLFCLMAICCGLFVAVLPDIIGKVRKWRDTWKYERAIARMFSHQVSYVWRGTQARCPSCGIRLVEFRAPGDIEPIVCFCGHSFAPKKKMEHTGYTAPYLKLVKKGHNEPPKAG